MKIQFAIALFFSSVVFGFPQMPKRRVIPHYSVNYEIYFWTDQFKEHAEFATDFTADPELKNEGNQLIARWKNFQKNYPKNQNKKETFLHLSKMNKDFQNKVKSGPLDENHPLYALHKDLLAHMDRETDYAVKKAQGKRLSKEDEVKFWAQEHQEEATAMNALINPGELPLKNRAQIIVQDLKDEKNVKSVLNANEALDNLSQRLEQNPQKSQIPAKLAKHEARERQRAVEILAQFEQ